ncbi:MAG: hypothetical protein M1570_05620 [Chloroflexi bacterium]|nr:hypothetical protein [Chloroflexota bacterium]
MKKPGVLWVEDSARLELRNLVGPLLFSNKFEFALAEDVTTAVRLLRAKPFDGVIVDIRLPPGTDPEWRKLYQQSGLDRVHAQLGLKLLYWLLTRDNSIHPEQPPDWIQPHHVGIFTVESRGEVERHLEALGIRVFRQKVAGLRDTTLLELIDEILTQGPSPK